MKNGDQSMYSAQLLQWHVFQNASTRKLRPRNVDRRPIRLEPVGQRLGIGHEFRLLPAGVRRDELHL